MWKQKDFQKLTNFISKSIDHYVKEITLLSYQMHSFGEWYLKQKMKFYNGTQQRNFSNSIPRFD